MGACVETSRPCIRSSSAQYTRREFVTAAVVDGAASTAVRHRSAPLAPSTASIAPPPPSRRHGTYRTPRATVSEMALLPGRAYDQTVCPSRVETPTMLLPQGTT